MTFQEYVASYVTGHNEGVQWQYTAAGTINYAGRIHSVIVTRTSATTISVTYSAEMVTQGGDNAEWMCKEGGYSSWTDDITAYQWHGQVENGYIYGATFTHTWTISASATSATLQLALGMEDVSGNEAWSSNATVTVSIPSWATYTVTFNANGGSGAPSAQTKQYGVGLVLSTTKPIRTNYIFDSWNTKSDGSGTSYASGGTYSKNKDVTLYAIWKGSNSTIAAQSMTLGDAATISWTNYGSNNYSFNLKIRDTKGTVISNVTNTESSLSFTATETRNLCTSLTDASTAKWTLELTTYDSDGKIVGTAQTATLTVTVKSTIIPTISSALSGQTDFGSSNVFVTSLCKFTETVTASGILGSSLRTLTMEVKQGTTSVEKISKTVSGTSISSSTITSSSLSVTGSNISVTVTVTDSRGKSASVTHSSITVYEYFNPRISRIRLNIDSNNLVTMQLVGKFASVNSLNTKNITIKRKNLSTAYEEEVYDAVQSSYDISNMNFYSETLSDVETVTYQYTVIFEDLKKTTSKVQKTAVICISRRAGGKGVALFKEAEKDGFEVNGNSYFDKNTYLGSGSTTTSMTHYMQNDNRKIGLQITDSGIFRIKDYTDEDNSYDLISFPTSADENPTYHGVADYVVAQGTSDSWWYRKWKSGRIELWGIKAFTNGITNDKTRLYTSAEQLYSLPSLGITGINSVQATVSGTYNVGRTASVSTMSSTQIGIRMASWQSETRSSGMNVNIYAVGTWS